MRGTEPLVRPDDLASLAEAAASDRDFPGLNEQLRLFGIPDDADRGARGERFEIPFHDAEVEEDALRLGQFEQRDSAAAQPQRKRLVRLVGEIGRAHV